MTVLVPIDPGLRAGGSRARIPAGARYFSFLKNTQTLSGALASYSLGPGDHSRGYSGWGVKLIMSGSLPPLLSICIYGVDREGLWFFNFLYFCSASFLEHSV